MVKYIKKSYIVMQMKLVCVIIWKKNCNR